MPKLLLTLFMLCCTFAYASDDVVIPPMEIMNRAKELAYKDFPTELDILAIIMVESSFNPYAVNKEESKINPKRKLPPSRGLMQVQNGSFDIYVNMRQGTALLREYYIKLKRNRKAAVKAYNIGIGAYKRGEAKISAEEYWAKFKARRKAYVKIYGKRGI